MPCLKPGDDDKLFLKYAIKENCVICVIQDGDHLDYDRPWTSSRHEFDHRNVSDLRKFVITCTQAYPYRESNHNLVWHIFSVYKKENKQKPWWSKLFKSKKIKPETNDTSLGITTDDITSSTFAGVWGEYYNVKSCINAIRGLGVSWAAIRGIDFYEIVLERE